MTTGEQLERVHAALPRSLADRIEEAMLGRVEGRAEMLLRILGRRVGPLSPEAEGRVRSATAHELDRWADALFEAVSLDDVFGDG